LLPARPKGQAWVGRCVKTWLDFTRRGLGAYKKCTEGTYKAMCMHVLLRNVKCIFH